MSVDVSPTNKNNTHHVSFEDPSTGTKYGLILSPNGNAIDRRPRQASQYVPFTQNDWSGGRGLKIATDDRSRFADSKRLNTRRPGLITLGGMETYTTGHRQLEQFMPADAGGVTWQALTGDDQFIANKVTISATGNRARLYFWVRRRGTPGIIKARLKNNNAGDPGTQAKLVQFTAAGFADTISMLFEFTFASVQAVNSAATYWVEIAGADGDDADNYWEVGVDADRTLALTKASPSGADGTWTNPTYDLYYRLVDDTDIAGVMFFQYKSQLYMLTRPTESAAPKLYMNGYRGVATGAGQSRTVLQDTTQAWQTDELAGSLLMIVEGPNSEWQQPYRTILSNDGDEITTEAFGKAHVAGETVYVILGRDKWTEITGHGLTVLPTSIACTDEICYFAQGDTVTMRRMREFLSGAVWTRQFGEEEKNYATELAAYRTASGLMICKANNAGNSGEPVFAQVKAEPWGPRLRFPQLIDDGESTSGWTFGANVTGSTDATIFRTKAKAIKAIKAAGSPTTTPFAYKSFTQYSLDAYKHTAIRFWVALTAGVRLTEGQLKVRFSLATDCSTSVQDVNAPAIVDDEWQQITIPYNDRLGEMKWLSSIGFISDQNFTIYIDGIELVPAGSEAPLGKDGGRVTGIELYGDPEVPWVFRSGNVGWIDNGVYNPVPLREYSQVENVHNGVGHLVHDVYLYFSFLQGLEEYYRSNLDDVGPNTDEGMPANRQGYITSMAGYPDRFLYNYDAGAGYSAIMTRKGGGHHEDYRCDAPGKRIRTIFIQVIPGDMADRLWFSEGEDVGYLPLPGNTVNELTDSTYRFTHEGVLETGWIGDDQQRIFSSVKLGLENASAARCIEWDYKLDAESNSWVPMSTPFTSGPVQSINLNKTGKLLKLRFRLQTNDNTQTPRITSLRLGTTAQDNVLYTYSMTFVYSDNARDLLSNVENYDRAETLLNQLDAWMLNKTPLTMRTQSEATDNKTVVLDPFLTRPVSNVSSEQQEKNSATLIAIEPQ